MGTDHRYRRKPSQITATLTLRAVAVALLVCAGAVGCGSSGAPGTGTARPPATALTSVPAAPTTSKTTDSDTAVDYTRLLLQPGDLSDADDTFAQRSGSATGPDGLPGASALFVNQDDTRAIIDSIVIYPDAETAAKTLQDAAPTLGSTLNDATSRPAPVGQNGTMAVGMSKDGSKAITLLLFTEGPALVRLEFQSAPGDVTTDGFVFNIGKMQQIALRIGLPR